MNVPKSSCVRPLILCWFIAIGVLALEGWLHELAASVPAQGGPPSLPARFYGAVTIDGLAAPAGTKIVARINGTMYATATTSLENSVAVYVIDVPGDNPGTSEIDGGRDGDIVNFIVGNAPTTQTGIWRFGGLNQLDLVAVTITPVTPVTPVTPTPSRSQPVSIPEPVTVTLFGIGLVGLAALGRRRRRLPNA